MGVGESRTFTRSEEELDLEGRRIRTVRRIRLRKRIVEEEVEVKVRVRREELEVVEEDVEPDADVQGDAGPLAEERLEILLREEEPVVGTRLVPRERVVVVREIVQDRQVVEETLRKEVIALEERPPEG